MTAAEVLRAALRGHLSPISLDVVLHRHDDLRSRDVAALDAGQREQIARALEDAVSLFSKTSRAELRRIIRANLGLEGLGLQGLEPEGALDVRTAEVRSLPIQVEIDVNEARNTARRLAQELGFTGVGAVKVATSVSELARNIVLYAGKGTIQLEPLASGEDPHLRVRAVDNGPGISPELLTAILGGRYVSRSGLGKGIVAVKRIASAFTIESKVGAGTTITAEFRGRR